MGLAGSGITDVSAFSASVPKPAVGTPVLAGDIEAGNQALANRTRWLADARGDILVHSYAANGTPYFETVSDGVDEPEPWAGASFTLAAGDVVKIEIAAELEVLNDNFASPNEIKVLVSEDGAPGYALAGCYTRLAIGAGATWYQHVTLVGLYNVAAPVDAVFRLFVRAANSGAGDRVKVLDYLARYQVIRAV